MTESIAGLILISLATAAASVTLARAKIAEPLRRRAASISPRLGQLFECPYCLSHWVALALLLGWRRSWWLPVEALAAVALSSPAAWLLLKYLEVSDEP